MEHLACYATLEKFVIVVYILNLDWHLQVQISDKYACFFNATFILMLFKTIIFERLSTLQNYCQRFDL